MYVCVKCVCVNCMRKSTVRVGLYVRVSHLSCCSFFTSASRAGKSIERRATRELTTSIPERILRMTFLPAMHSSEWSSGAIRLILTRHGRMARMSSSRQHARVWISDFSIALKTSGETGVARGMTTHARDQQHNLPARICENTDVLAGGGRCESWMPDFL